MTLNGHGEAVADEDAFDAGFVEQLGDGEIVGGQHRDLATGLFEPREFGDGDAGRFGTHGTHCGAWYAERQGRSVRVVKPRATHGANGRVFRLLSRIFF